MKVYTIKPLENESENFCVDFCLSEDIDLG